MNREAHIYAIAFFLALTGLIGHVTYVHRHEARPAQPAPTELQPLEPTDIETTQEKLERIRRRDAAAHTEARLHDQNELNE